MPGERARHVDLENYSDYYINAFNSISAFCINIFSVYNTGGVVTIKWSSVLNLFFY